MKAITLRGYGDSDALTVTNIDAPAVVDQQVLVEVHAAGLDMGVWHQITGLPYLARTETGIVRPKHPVPGSDFAGRVVAVGRDVDGVAVGDEVFGTADGTFAEYAVTTVDRIAPRPRGLDAVEAAALPTSAVAALQALRDKARVQPDDRVLVIGASGGVGSYAVQMAKAFGADVTGVASPKKLDFVRGLGADHVIDYTQEEIDASGSHWDVILDGGGNRPVRLMRRVLSDRGTLVFFGGEQGGRWTGGTGRWLRGLLLSPFVPQHLRALTSSVRPDDLRTVTALVDATAVVPAIDQTFPLADVAAALGHLRAGRALGKVVITT